MEAVLRFEGLEGDVADILNEPQPYTRSTTNYGFKDGYLEVRIEAKDISSLRAAVNDALRLLRIVLDIKEVLG